MFPIDRGIIIVHGELADKAQQLRYALRSAITTNPADSLLLSGGVDSSILAAIDPKIPAITVVLEGHGSDLRHAQQVTEYLGTPWYSVEINQARALDDIREVIRLTGSYDPAVKNDIPIYEGLRYSASLGHRIVRTGDAADGLFAGYSYLHQPNLNLEQWVRDLIPNIRLSSSRIARSMGLQITYPYLYQEVLDSAQKMQRSDLIRPLELGRPGDYAQLLNPELSRLNTWGKIILRVSAYGLLPNEIVWRTKTDLEFGSGTDIMESILEESVTRQEIREMRRSGKSFWSKYHGKLYLIYKELGLEPQPPEIGQYSCSWCGGGVLENRHHCQTCGGYPVNQENRFLFQKSYPENQYRRSQ
ncbi:MAG: hypothetical protein ACD_30C00073G0007 [uncultured bacterium]|uniref:Asparagine synthase 1 n=3 Tax=Candidatus Daviesiibacteriota TaxID=1752718 RepID=A0A0G0EMG6_9BACT|nr:MAG: hypothetical protein ACD_30C00073G0007 [uncultured bacterium]KKQ08233.1 MAG: Asparagine synthase 1 [Candidatus Daviesbacteria bacterium GW2011_GWB1_36_5]KKQ16031.1 MAG: Asparagine synthase 1 [Candidatus Daviesbacteria bacterium GW2011_GWA1_36_8]OGE32274.1 MAG: hypothetical protein A3C99_03375 [Candidatus Daviesbacteria bacterium RIFCSPHIGHO2_02_FULL_37_9]OGE36368.1 MAG: hypothetical protein A3E66_05750 [Candidatus Daviesbacteria bacterium RIFCSPHIGHO2_12_FULL_37_16]